MRFQDPGAQAVRFAAQIKLQRRTEAPITSSMSDCTHTHFPPVAGALGWRSVVAVVRVKSPPWKIAGEVALKPSKMACQLALLLLSGHGGRYVQVREKRPDAAPRTCVLISVNGNPFSFSFVAQPARGDFAVNLGA